MQRPFLRVLVPLVPLVPLVALGSFARAQVHEEWFRTVDASPTGIDSANAVALTPSGEVVVGGKSGAQAALTWKYAADGTLLWSRSFTYGLNVDAIYAVVVDPSDGSIYATGRVDPPGASTAGLVLKYDALGTLLWSAELHDTFGTAQIRRAVRSSNGGLLVAGTFGQGDTYAAEYDALGNHLWTTHAPGGDYVSDLVTDASGNVLLAGSFDESGATTKFKVAKFAPGGALVWLREVSAGGAGSAASAAVAFDASGEIYAAGRLIEPAGNSVHALAKLSAAGNVLWTRTGHGTDPLASYSGESLRAIAFGPDGNVRAAGVTTNLGTEGDIHVVEYTPAGTLVWQATWDGPAHEVDAAIRLTSEGDGSLTVLGRAELLSGSYDPAVLRFDSHGVLQSAHVRAVAPNGYALDALSGPGGLRVFSGQVAAGPGTTTNAYVLTERDEFVSFCFGDGLASACPCGNSGAVGNGCANSSHATGAHLLGTGSASVSADGVTLTATQLTGSIAIFFQGATQSAPLVIDDGIGCVGGPIVRLGNQAVGGGAAFFPDIGDPSISVRGALPPAGGTYYYQCFYRNAASSFCPPATSNRTNGVAISWGQ